MEVDSSPPPNFMHLIAPARKAYNYNGECVYVEGSDVLREQYDVVLVQVFC